MSERDELRERVKAHLMSQEWNGSVLELVLPCVERERDRAWNEALDEAKATLRSGSFTNRLIDALKRPQPPAQQDDKPKIEWRTGSEWEDVDGADGSKPIVQSAPPAPFDIERRARELVHDNVNDGPEAVAAFEVAIALAREAHAAGAREKAEEIDDGIQKERDEAQRSGASRDYLRGLSVAGAFARSHARPPKPAPETKTREQRLEETMREVLMHTAVFFGSGEHHYDQAKVEKLRGAEMTEIRDLARRALEKP